MITIGTVAKNIKEGDHILMRDGVARQVEKIHYQEDIIAFEMKRYEEKKGISYFMMNAQMWWRVGNEPRTIHREKPARKTARHRQRGHRGRNYPLQAQPE